MKLFHKMADDNVLFLRGNGNDTIIDNEDAWDDSALIKAYDKAVNLAKEEVVKRIGMEVQNSEDEQKSENSKQHPHTNKPYEKLTVGAPCRAIYSEDGEVYEAIISKIYENTETCIVKFVGYGNTEKVELKSLLESEGLQSQLAQQKAALAVKFNEENVETNEINYSTNINPRMYNGEKMDCESEEAKTYKHDFMAGPSFTSAADIMPPAPPLPPQLMAKLPDDDTDALSSYYHGLRQARSQKKMGKKC